MKRNAKSVKPSARGETRAFFTRPLSCYLKPIVIYSPSVFCCSVPSDVVSEVRENDASGNVGRNRDGSDMVSRPAFAITTAI